MTTIPLRLQALREEMQREHLAAVIIPSSDPHQSEYTAAHWKGREYISGFDGSAGTAVVTMSSAALWTDSRYFLAAEEQLRGTGFQLMKLKIDGTPTIAEWIHEQCTMSHEPSTEVLIDGMVASANEVRQLTKELRSEGGLTLRTNTDLLGRVWRNRPTLPPNPVEIFPMEYAGESCESKLQRIRQALRQQHADGMLMASLDDIAWTLNLRGTDVHCTPVFVSYLLITSHNATLFINKEKLTPEVERYLSGNGVVVADYTAVKEGLRNYFEYNILIDPDEVSHTLYKELCNKELWSKDLPGSRIIEAESPVKRMKTVKNAVEQEGFRRAMLRDGVAMVKFLYWLDEAYKAYESYESYKSYKSYESHETHEPLTELSISEKLRQLRAEQPLFRDISFDTIAAYGQHGAVVHYEPTAETDIPLLPEGLLLLDSGAQYLDGTTDITRTIVLGPLTEEMRRVYTLVLKGHIQVELARFPSGISGTQLDVLAKRAMWRDGLSYLHGTGHGVGTYLSVHEGPHQIRMEWKPAPLVAGMTVTDEPGIYLAGRFGVRIENTLLIVPAKPRGTDDRIPQDGVTEFGQFLQFEPLTLCPIDKRPIMTELLDDEERQWLDDYHQVVYERLAPMLAESEKKWLKTVCSPL
ncbi:MAG: aminopeptidase P family protein [Prevotella sp.]|nr:aminopeptidase P family protein [Prevotella sp.]